MEINYLPLNCLEQYQRTPCLFLVYESIAQMRRVEQEFISTIGDRRCCIGSQLSARLLDIPVRQYTDAIMELLVQELQQISSGPVICTEIDLLFEPTLGLNPFALLRDCSRYRPLIIFWPGSYDGQLLTYAEPGHAHCRTWRQPEIQSGCIQMIV